MNARTTNLVIVLLIVAAATSATAFAHLRDRREQAISAWRDLASVRADVRDLTGSVSLTPSASGSSAGADLSGGISAAASSAGISGQLASIEPGRPSRLEGSDYDETEVVVRFAPLTLRQIGTFVDQLKAADPGARPKIIALAAPAAPAPDQAASAPAAGGDETWSCDITLSYLSLARSEENPRP